MRWKNDDGKIRPHSSSHHAHTRTGQPVYHDEDFNCHAMSFGGGGFVGGKMVRGRGDDHHGELDHDHKEE